MDITQALYPPPYISKADELAAAVRDTAVDICKAESLQAFIASKQQRTLGVLPEAVSQPAATLLKS